MAALSSSDLSTLTDFHGTNAGIDPDWLRAIALTESGGDPTQISPTGAKGLMQFTSTTARKAGVLDPFDVNQAIPGAAFILKQNLARFGDPYQASLAYNAGWDPSKWDPAYGDKVAANYYRITRRPLGAASTVPGPAQAAASAQQPTSPVQQTTETEDPGLREFEAATPQQPAAPAQQTTETEDPGLREFESLPGRGGGVTVPSGALEPQLASAGAPISAAQLEAMPWWQRAALNVATGVGNVELGITQLASKIPGLSSIAPSEQQMAGYRRLQAQLAEATPGGRALQIAGEVAPQVAIPYGAATRGAAAGISMIPYAERAVPWLTRAAAPGVKLGMGGAMLEGALQGGAGGLVMPVTAEESRAANVAAGAGLGLALPLAVNAIGAGASLLSRATGIGGGRQTAAGRALVRTLGGPDAAAEVADRLDIPPVQLVPDAPHSSAVVTQSPELAALEKGSRIRNPASWVQHDAAVDQARTDYLVNQATTDADRVGELKDLRDQATAPLRTSALNTAANYPQIADPVNQVADWLATGPARANPAVQRVAQYVKQNLGEGATPNDLYTVKKVLTDKLTAGGVPDELGAAAKQAQAETMQLINAIDDALHNASGGQWSRYNQQYGAQSQPVRDAQAQANIRDKFAGAQGIPGARLTPARFNQIVLGEAQDAWGPTMLPETMEKMRTLSSDLNAGNIVTRVKQSMAPGDAGTAGNILLAEAAGHVLGGIPGMGILTGMAKEAGGTGAEKILTDALQNPEQLRELLNRAFNQSVVPLRAQLIRNALRLGPLAGYGYVQPLPAAEGTPQ